MEKHTKHCAIGRCVKSHDGITCKPDGVTCEHYIPDLPALREALDEERKWRWEDMAVPPIARASLTRYVEERVPTGGFLEAVLCNNLKESFARADLENRKNLGAIVYWLYNSAPSNCWGSPKKVRDWLNRIDEVK